MSDGLYIIEGNRIFAKVMSYKTKEYDLCNIEAHNKYIDIQSSILGAESIDVFDRSRLVTDKPYDDAEDFELFNSENALLLARNNNFPGYFSLLYPHDAHRPMQRILGFEQVKKFVIKVEIDK
jgi:YhcH/YjgK/YiaL family protein